VRSGTLVSVNLAKVRDNPAASDGPAPKPPQTGIDKRPAAGPVQVSPFGVAGDTICDTRHHGGPDQAVYAYDQADTQWWQERIGAQLAFELAPGSFGENLTVAGLDVTHAVIGELWAVGSAVLEVCVPRIPCTTFAAFWGLPGLVKRFTEAGRPGTYLRVLESGELCAGDEVRVLTSPAHGLTVEMAFRAMTGDHSLAPALLGAPELPIEVHERARRWLAGAAH
jgi:MOSC domain-containing protein YiiM